MNSTSIDESLPEHPPEDLMELFVALDNAGVPPENMPEFAAAMGENDAD